MKVLIVDDGMEKVDEFRSLQQSGSVASNCEIIHRTNILEGAIVLLNDLIDLLILDVLVPKEPGGEASAVYSVEFAEEIIRNKRLNFPLEIVALTKEDNEVAESLKKLSELGIASLSIGREDDWRLAIVRLMRSAHLKSERLIAALGPPRRKNVEFAIVCALMQPEYSELLKACSDARRVQDVDLTLAEVTIEVGGEKKVGVIACSGGPGVCRMAYTSKALLAKYEFPVILLVGIMGGNSAHVSLGDLVICDETWDIHAGKWKEYEDGKVGFRPDMHLASCSANPSKVEQYFVENPRIISDFWMSWDSASKPREIPKIIRGPVACSSSVIASKDKLGEMELNKRKVIGVEMEAFGLYSVCSFLRNGPRAISIKAVSDLCDKDKSDDFQRYCSWLSAVTVIHLLGNDVI